MFSDDSQVVVSEGDAAEKEGVEKALLSHKPNRPPGDALLNEERRDPGGGGGQEDAD